MVEVAAGEGVDKALLQSLEYHRLHPPPPQHHPLHLPYHLHLQTRGIGGRIGDLDFGIAGAAADILHVAETVVLFLFALPVRVLPEPLFVLFVVSGETGLGPAELRDYVENHTAERVNSYLGSRSRFLKDSQFLQC